jgi:hypothetical protein
MRHSPICLAVLLALLCHPAVGQAIKVRTLEEQGFTDEDRKACEQLKATRIAELEQKLEQLEEAKASARKDKDRDRMKTLLTDTKAVKLELIHAENKPAEDWYGDLLESRKRAEQPDNEEPPPPAMVAKPRTTPPSKPAPPRRGGLSREPVRWSVIDKVDELTDERIRGVLIFSDGEIRNSATMIVAFRNTGEFDLSIRGGDFDRFFPDDIRDRKVAVTYRAKDGPLRNEKWLVTSDGKSAGLVDIDPEAILEIFGGESLIVQFDTSGKRYTFTMEGPQGDELRAVLRKEVEGAGKAKAR